MPIFTGEFPYGDRAVVSSGPQRDETLALETRQDVRKERIAEGAFDDSAEGEFTRTAGNGRAFDELRQLQDEAFETLADGQPPNDQLFARVNALRRTLEPDRRMPEVTFLRGHVFDQPLASGGAGTLRMESAAGTFRFRAALPSTEFQPQYMRDTLRMFRAGLLAGVSPGFRIPPARVDPNAEQLVRDPGEDAFTRVVRNAVLYELSLVTRPVYKGTRMFYRRDEAGLLYGPPGVLTLEEGGDLATRMLQANRSPGDSPGGREDEELLWL